MRSRPLFATACLTSGLLGFAPAFAAEPVPVNAPAPAKLKDAGPADEKAVRALLKESPKFEGDPAGIPLQDLLQIVAKTHGLTVRLDFAGFKRFQQHDGGAAMAMGAGAGAVFIATNGPATVEEITQLFDVKIRLNLLPTVTLADVLSDLCAQLPGKCAYRIRHNQVLIGPAFLPPVVPGSGVGGGGSGVGGAGPNSSIPPHAMTEQLLGESVSAAIDDKPLTDAIAELRKCTGANIVLDARCKDKAKQAVSGTFDDTRLFTALELLADMCDLKVVSNNNVFYVTSPDNAAKMQKRIDRDLFGEAYPEQPMTPFAPALPGKDEPKK